MRLRVERFPLPIVIQAACEAVERKLGVTQSDMRSTDRGIVSEARLIVTGCCRTLAIDVSYPQIASVIFGRSSHTNAMHQTGRFQCRKDRNEWIERVRARCIELDDKARNSDPVFCDRIRDAFAALAHAHADATGIPIADVLEQYLKEAVAQ